MDGPMGKDGVDSWSRIRRVNIVNLDVYLFGVPLCLSES